MTLTVLQRTMRAPAVVVAFLEVSPRNLLALLAAVALAGCGDGHDPGLDDAGGTRTDGPGAVVDDRGGRVPPPGKWAGRTTQRRHARLQVLPGGRIHFRISTRLPCPGGRAISAASFPDKLPVLDDNGGFSYQESGDGNGLDYTMRIYGQIRDDFAAGTFKGTASRPDGLTCAAGVRWTAARLRHSGD
jgi:hypothetical protein